MKTNLHKQQIIRVALCFAVMLFCALWNLACSTSLPENEQIKSLDEVDAASWGYVRSPLQHDARRMLPVKGDKGDVAVNFPGVLSLNGGWMLAPDKDGRPDMAEAVCADVPCSVHTALLEADKIPDPMLGMNDSIALRNSYRGWWMIREFDYTMPWKGVTLNFSGIANRCTVFLNGHQIAAHEGMFGGPFIDVSGTLKRGANTLAVKLEPVPNIATGMTGLDRDSWRNSVVINCVYGWHYAKIMPLGIWQDVTLRELRRVNIGNLFIAACDTCGNMLLTADVSGPIKNGEIRLCVRPRNFSGEAQFFSCRADREGTVHADFKLENPRLWWPNDMGPQNLYDAWVTLVSDKGKDEACTSFGVRTVGMSPLPEGKAPDRYNWVMTVNGEEMFVKGTNWCTVDAILRMDSLRYASMLGAAKDQHLQLLRAWGGGAPETDCFYSMCDSLGLMVFQEWPTAWNSHDEQPYDVLSETVRLNTLRLRNHPSLVMWGGGNESTHPFGRGIDMMGRASVELDGTRPFHRGEPWGGSRHDYGCWWGNLHLDHNLNMTADFWGEYGIPSMPDRETVDRYLDGERYHWPVAPESRFNHHMPVFGGVGELGKAEQLCRYFMRPDSLDDFILGTQLAQVVGGCSVAERARTRRPHCSGVWYYKLNDVYPALSWSSVDYYGCRKPYHYFMRRSMAPEASVILFDRTNLCAQRVSLPHYLLDDFKRLSGKTVKVHTTVYNYNMHPVYDEEQVVVPDGNVVRLPDIELTNQMTDSELLLFKTDLTGDDGTLIARNWYFTNYETRAGQLVDFPGHVSGGKGLKWHRDGGAVVITNDNAFPVVGVDLRMPGRQSALVLTDNYLWLDPGETVAVGINLPGTPEITAWNM